MERLPPSYSVPYGGKPSSRAERFWSPLAVLEQNPDPMWAKGQALLSIGRLHEQIRLLQQTFDIKPFEAQLPVPVLSATPSFPVVAQREEPEPVIPTPPSSVPSD